jgi:hypothetical protein
MMASTLGTGPVQSAHENALILDTNIPIVYERGAMDRSSLDDDELAIAWVSVAEYRVGIEMADTTTEQQNVRGRSWR